MQKKKKLTVLFIGDIFGLPGIITIEKYLGKIKNKYKVDYIIAQGENITGRKGLNELDYIRLKKQELIFLQWGIMYELTMIYII